jgi:hypothetical protein
MPDWMWNTRTRGCPLYISEDITMLICFPLRDTTTLACYRNLLCSGSTEAEGGGALAYLAGMPGGPIKIDQEILRDIVPSGRQ